MRKFLFLAMSAAMSLLAASCGGGSSPSDEPDDGGFVHGEYRVEITQEFVGVNPEDCYIIYAFSEGDGISDGIYDATTGKNMGMAFTLSDDQTRVTKMSYKTGKNGIDIMFALGGRFMNGATGTVNIEMSFYLGGKLLGTEHVTMTGDFGPVTYSTDKWTNRD